MKGASRKKYAVAAGIGTAIFLVLTFVQGGFVEEDPEIRWRILCDALFVPGILLGSFGLLLFAAGGGVFDMLKYGTIKAFSFLMPKKRREMYPKTFFDFKMEREARERTGFGHLLIVGLVFLILAGAALVMYSQYAPVW